MKFDLILETVSTPNQTATLTFAISCMNVHDFSHAGYASIWQSVHFIVLNTTVIWPNELLIALTKHSFEIIFATVVNAF